MTVASKDRGNTPSQELLSLLPPDPALRVKQSEFARLVGVSRQTVSQWVKKGVIVPYPDGRFCPKEAARRVIGYTDPSRLRAKILRPLSDDVATLRKEALDANRRADLEAKRADAAERELRHADAAVDRLGELVIQNRAEIAQLEPGSEIADEYWMDLHYRALEETASAAGPSESTPPPADGNTKP